METDSSLSLYETIDFDLIRSFRSARYWKYGWAGKTRLWYLVLLLVSQGQRILGRLSQQSCQWVLRTLIPFEVQQHSLDADWNPLHGEQRRFVPETKRPRHPLEILSEESGPNINDLGRGHRLDCADTLAVAWLFVGLLDGVCNSFVDEFKSA